MTKPIKLIRCLVRYNRLDMATNTTEEGCSAHVVIPSNVAMPTLGHAARKALRDQVGEAGLVEINRVRLARFAGVESVA